MIKDGMVKDMPEDKVIYELKDGKGYVKEYNMSGISYFISFHFGEKYFYDYDLLYEGEYINGERNGKGKEYSLNNKLLYEGEYLNGKRNGLGKEYDKNGNLIYEGEYLDDKKKKSEKIKYKKNYIIK